MKDTDTLSSNNEVGAKKRVLKIVTQLGPDLFEQYKDRKVVVEKIVSRADADGTTANTIEMHEENEYKLVADALFKILIPLGASGQTQVWPSEDDEGTNSPAGTKIRLVGFTLDGKPRISEEIFVPQRPYVFLDAVEAYRDGKDEIEIQKILANDPDLKDAQVKKGILVRLGQIKSLHEITQVVPVVNAIRSSRLKGQLYNQMGRTAAQIVQKDAKNMQTIQALNELKSTISDAFRASQLVEVPSVESFDVVDARVLEVAWDVIKNPKANIKDIRALIGQLKGYAFSMGEFQSRAVLSAAKVVETKGSVRYARSRKRLEDIRTATAATPTLGALSEEVKAEIQRVIDAKIARYYNVLP